MAFCVISGQDTSHTLSTHHLYNRFFAQSTVALIASLTITHPRPPLAIKVPVGILSAVYVIGSSGLSMSRGYTKWLTIKSLLSIDQDPRSLYALVNMAIGVVIATLLIPEMPYHLDLIYALGLILTIGQLCEDTERIDYIIEHVKNLTDDTGTQYQFTSCNSKNEPSNHTICIQNPDSQN